MNGTMDRKRIRILAESSMTDIDGNNQKLRHAGYGFLKIFEDRFSVSYTDRQGEEEIEIELVCCKEQIQMRRDGDAKGCLSFRPGQKIPGTYSWGFVDMDIEIETRKMDVSCNDSEGQIHLCYYLYIGGMAANEVDYKCKWKC